MDPTQEQEQEQEQEQQEEEEAAGGGRPNSPALRWTLLDFIFIFLLVKWKPFLKPSQGTSN